MRNEEFIRSCIFLLSFHKKSRRISVIEKLECGENSNSLNL